MFWLAMAPTMGRTCTQRAATAGEDEEIAIPNMPVLGQRAVKEKVMASPQRSSAITAMASISTSHSGRASADTTSPVDTGNTPLSHLPTVR
jgi:hypothetical protein